ncbi:hypothetical protein GCM10010304_45910 [Streptomyces roseoviolaceus]
MRAVSPIARAAPGTPAEAETAEAETAGAAQAGQPPDDAGRQLGEPDGADARPAGNHRTGARPR